MADEAIDEAPETPDTPQAEGTPPEAEAPETPEAPSSDTQSEQHIAWAAGLFEGEGCIYLTNNRSGQSYVHLTVVSTDEDVLSRFHRTVGVGNVYTKRPREDHHKPSWQWRCARRDDVAHVKNLLLPHLGERRTGRWAELDSLATTPIR